jgi:hypothetical protein
MFTKRIIPCLDVNNGRVVKGINFVDLRDAGDPVEVASMYDKSGADELVFLDITASSDGRNTTCFANNESWKGDCYGIFPDYWAVGDNVQKTLDFLIHK